MRPDNATCDRNPFILGSAAWPGRARGRPIAIGSAPGTWFVVCLNRTRTKRHKDFGAQGGNLLGICDEHAVGIVGGTGDRQVEDRTAKIGDRNQVALVGGVDRFLGGWIFIKLAAGENPVDCQGSLRLLVSDPLAGVGLAHLSVLLPSRSTAITEPVGGSNLGTSRTGVSGFGTREQQAGMNRVRNGVGGEDRLVLLGSLGAHEVFQVTLPQHHPGSQDHLFRCGIEPEVASQAFPGGIGLENTRLRLGPVIGQEA